MKYNIMNKKLSRQRRVSLRLIIVLVVPVILFMAISWLAPQREVSAKSQKVNFRLPASAVQINDNLYSLGTAFDRKSGEKVEGYAIIHRKNEAARSSGAKTTPVTCYGFLAKDAKWKNVEPWVVNSTNTRSLDPVFVFDNLGSNIVKWEKAAAYNILGDGTMTSAALSADTMSPDNQNEVYFTDLSDPNTIAITIIWGVFGGPTFQRKLVEWDQVYDDTTYDWSASGEPGKMDFENIATHELGHSVGMADLYNSSCAKETMYGYAAYGEIQKRDLNAGDIVGVNKLY